MIKKIVVLIITGVVGLSAELWINAIRDPGAELGIGDWETDTYEWPDGAGDSAQVDVHDSSRAHEGDFSFLTDTEKHPGIESAVCNVWCYQYLEVSKAVRDLDSCEWTYYVTNATPSDVARFFISFRTANGKTLLWYASAASSEGSNDTLYSMEFPLPNSSEWKMWGGNLRNAWTNYAGWSENDTIVEVQLLSRGIEDVFWNGQDLSWDNIYLEGLAYYDYAAVSIDSDELADKRYTPVATFANEGIKDDQPGSVYAEILEGATRVYIDSQEVSIPAESSEQITFAEWAVPHDGSYTLRVYPILELDEYSEDDTSEMVLTGINISENQISEDLALEVQSLTSPLNVSYYLPQSEKGTLTLFDASGRRVERITVTRSGSAELGALPSGMYFIRLLTGDRSLTIKAVVVN